MRAMVVNRAASPPGGRGVVVVGVVGARNGAENDANEGSGGPRMRRWWPSREMDANERGLKLSWRRPRARHIKMSGEKKVGALEEENLMPPSPPPPSTSDENSLPGRLETMLGEQQTGSEQPAGPDKRILSIARLEHPRDKTCGGLAANSGDHLARNQNHHHHRRRRRAPRTFIKLWGPWRRWRRMRRRIELHQVPLLLLFLLMQIASGPLSGPIIYQANCVASPSSSSGLVSAAQESRSARSNDQPQQRVKTHVRVGILLEESNYEQANMFIRTIKMINEQKDETIRRLLSVFAAAAAAKQHPARASGSSTPPADVHSVLPPLMQNELQADDDDDDDHHHQDDHHGFATTATEMQRQQDRKPEHRLHDEPSRSSISASRASKVHEGLAGVGSAARQQRQKQQQQRQQQQRRLAQQQSHTYGGGESANSAAVANESAPTSAAYDRAARQARTITSEHLVNFDIKLDPMIEFLRDRHSALEADEKVCQLIESGVQAIFGPTDGRAISHVQSICDNLEIPYFELRSFIGGSGSSPASSPPSTIFGVQAGHAHQTSGPDGKLAAAAQEDVATPTFKPNHAHHQEWPTDEAQMATTTTTSATVANKLEALTVNLYPPDHLLNSAYVDLIYALNWTSFAVVYEDGSSMIRLQNIFKETSPSSSWANRWRIRLFRYDGGQAATTTTTTMGDGSESIEAPSSEPSQDRSTQLHADLANVSSAALNLVYAAKHRPGDALPTLLHDDQHANRRRSQRDTEQPPGGSTSSYRDVFWRVKLSGEHNILLDVKTDNLYEALKQAQQVGCMTEEYSYLITSLDLHMINLEDFKYSRTKITGLSLLQVAKTRQDDEAAAAAAPKFDEQYLENLGLHLIQQSSLRPTAASSSDTKLPSKSSLKQQQLDGANSTKASSTSSSSFNWLNEAESNDQTRREMLQSSPASLGLLPTVDRNNEQKLFDFFLEQQRRNLSRARLSTSSAILHDSLILFMLGLSELDPSGQFLRGANGGGGGEGEYADDAQQDRGEPYRSNARCSLEAQPWAHGSSLVNYMKQIAFTGLTGLVSFDQRGLRRDFKLDVLGMAPNLRLVKVGEWHSRAAAEETRNRFGYHHHHHHQLAGSYQAAGQDQSQLPSGASGVGSKAASTSPDGQEKEEDNFVETQSAADANVDAHMDSKSYDELSSRYESQLRRYHELLASGGQVRVPYGRRVSPNGALLVNEIIFERLYREQADKVDTLIVTAKLSQPYFMLKETPSKLDGNDQFEGYAVDLIHELSKLVNFRYKWREVADKKYGSKEVLPNGTVVWNGMIGEIVRGTADLAIVDLTITAQREEAVDFTLPFMNTGISILFKKPTTKVTTLFSFLSPFSSDVWAYVLAAYCGISAILFLVGHLSPYEWADPHPCRHLNPDSDLTVLKNQFSLLNSFWFTIGSLMQQGSDLTPRSMSTRTIAGIWYFFTLIMISSYTANLAAFLTVEKVVYPIENVRDLSAQQEIKYGCVESGSTCLFFHDSQIDTYKKIDETMRRHRTYVRSNDEGQKRVGEGKFAFFMESTTIEYIVERNCNLTQIGGLIDSKGYGLATSKKSRHKRPYRTLLNEGILHLQETGMLHVLKNRWWKEKRGGGTCTDDGKGGGVTELSLANVGGVFVVLLGGLGISFLVAIAEFIWRARRSGSTRDRMCEEMMNDLKFALACKSSTKPIQMTGNGNNFKRAPKLSRGGGGGGGGPNGATDGGEPTTTTTTASNNRRFHAPTSDSLRATANGLIKHYDHERANGVGCQPAHVRGSQRQQGRMSSGAQVKHAGPAARQINNKQCDPILLHAMLTMLSSNPDLAAAQAELDLAAGDHRRQLGGPLLPHSSTYDENLSRQLHLMNHQHSSTSQTNDPEDDEEEFEDEEGSDQPTRTDPPRRRQMLWSQQTIDTD